MKKWTVFIEHLELSQKLYCLEYDDQRIANITKEQFESFEILLGKAPEQPRAGKLRHLIIVRPRGIGKMTEWIKQLRPEVKIEESDCQKKLKNLEASRKDLLKAFKRYGHHDSPCAGILDLNEDSECICGFEATIKKEG